MNQEKIERNIKLVNMRDDTGLSFAKIGEQLGISKQMANKVYHQTKKKLVPKD
jgi:hypothetical protein